jgi:prepilin-type N-terminal cleavage/methylation domain-containing protein
MSARLHLRRRRERRAGGLRAGFTLTELMISLMIMAIVTVFLAELFTRQSRAYAVVENVTEVQHNLRAIAHLLEREMRSSSMLVPEGAALCGLDNTNTSDVIFVTDSQALDAGLLQNDLGATVSGGTYSGTGTEWVTINNAVLDGDAFYDIDNDGTPDSDFQIGAGVIIVDAFDPGAGASCGVVTNVDLTGAHQIQVDYAFGGAAIGGADLVAVPAHVYQINVANQLLRDGLVLADNVEDLQFSAFYDVDGNGQITSVALEHPGSNGGTVYASDNWDNGDLREIRVSFVARSRLPDPDFTAGTFQATENRVAPAGTDGFRRRIYRAIVRPRNVGQRQGT